MPHPSADKLASAIADFAQNEIPAAMLLRGEWGVGKTYACKAALDALRKGNQLKSYAYVSLYGVGSLPEIYNRILLGLVFDATGKSGKPANQASEAFENIAGLLRGVVGKKIPDSIVGGIVTGIGMLARKTLVVLDDMERRDESLTIKAVLGAVSYLMELRDCRVMVISNDQALSESDAVTFSAHKEKIFDLEYHYQPSIEENLNLMSRGENHDILYPPVSSLQTRNLRAIKRADSLLTTLGKKITAEAPRTKREILQNAAVLAVLHYACRDKVNLATRNPQAYISILIAERDSSRKESISEQDAILARAAYCGGPGDGIISEYLTTGRINWDDLNDEALRLEPAATAREMDSQMSTLFRAVSSNYQLTTEQAIRQLADTCDKHAELIPPSSLKYAASLIQQLGGKANAKIWLDRWIAAALLRLNDDQLNDDISFREQLPAEVIKAIQIESKRRHKAAPDIQTPLFRRFCEHSWSPKDHERMAKLPQTEFTSWIETSTHPDVGHIIRGVLKEFPHEGPSERIIAKKIGAAVRSLAKKSPINRLRAQRYFPQVPKGEKARKPRPAC